MGKSRRRSKGRRRSVKLDTSGLRKFENILGNGVTFKLGLFNKQAATKGAYLEFGTYKQPARPWLSSVLRKGRTRDQILEAIIPLIGDAIKGQNSKAKVAKKMVPILQMHLLQQRFEAVRLASSTIRKKAKKGAVDPTLIGIDSFHLATYLDVKATGGRQHRSKK